MATGVIVADELDDFPSSTRPGSGGFRKGSKQLSDVAIVLNSLVDKYNQTGTSPVLRFLDYNVDEDGQPVEDKVARMRASARIQAIRDQGFNQENGWVIASRDGAVYAKYFGNEANIPEKFRRKVGEKVPV